MIEKKYRRIIATILVIVVAIVLVGVQRRAADAAEPLAAEEELPIEYNTSPDIVKDHYFGDIKFWNIVLNLENGLSTLSCEATITGSELFQGTFRLIFFDQDDNKMIEMLRYIGEELFPDETRTITSSTDMNLMEASRLEFSMSGSVTSIEKMSIIQKRTIENLLNST